MEKSVFLEGLWKILQKDQWIIDGNYASTMEVRLQACDTVIFLDYPTELCLRGIRERKGKVRTDMPWVETDEEDPEFIGFIKNYKAKSRPEVMALLEAYSHKNILVFTSREEADRFLNRLRSDN